MTDQLARAATADAPSVRAVRATDPDDAQAGVSEVYLPHRLEVTDRDRHLDMELLAVKLGATTVGRLRYGRETRLETVETHEVHVDVPLAGSALMASEGLQPVAARPGQAAVFPRGRVARLQWGADCEQVCVMVPQAVLEDEVVALTGRPLVRPLEFDFVMDLRTTQGRAFRGVLGLVAEDLQTGGVVTANAAAARHLERVLLDALLLGQRHTWSREVLDPRGQAPRRSIAQAVALLHEHPAEAWSSTVLAREVHVSVRALQDGFARDLGTSPMGYLRRLRLAGARQDLRSAAPGSTTVTTIAHRWGLLHHGRFAAAYRDAFGELPSDTLAADLD